MLLRPLHQTVLGSLAFSVACLKLWNSLTIPWPWSILPILCCHSFLNLRLISSIGMSTIAWFLVSSFQLQHSFSSGLWSWMPSHVYQLFIDGVTQRCRSDLISVQAQFLSSCPLQCPDTVLVQCLGTVLVILSSVQAQFLSSVQAQFFSSCPLSRHSPFYLVQCPDIVLVKCSGRVLVINQDKLTTITLKGNNNLVLQVAVLLLQHIWYQRTFKLH